MAYSDTFLADLKSRVAISEVIGRSVKLRRDGKEFRAIDNKSLTINDAKGIWHDHATNEGGDVLSWLQKSSGISFTDAVAEIASIAGVQLPNGTGADNRPPKKAEASKKPANSVKRDIAATYDYTDAVGELLYQVVRLEWMEDGERQKTFRQRRPDPEKPGEWIWNLEGVQHGLYRLVDLREAGADETVFLPEGEKDVETLIGFGLTATTNSGGARNWRKDHAEALRGRDVVVLVDNDDPGRERGQTVAASLHGIASRVRILDFARGIWPQAPKGADVTDWVKAREGTAEELAEIVAGLPDARPAPYVPTMGLMMWADRNIPGRQYEFIVDDLIPERQIVVIIGETGTGKSFLTSDMMFSLCRGVRFFGRRIIRPMGAIWCAYEAAEGATSRMRAYARHHGLGDEYLPFAAFQMPMALWPLDPNGGLLIKEIQGVHRSEFNGFPLGAIVVDTYNAATPGASEIDSEVVSKIRSYFHHVVQETGATLIIVGHTNSAGKHRGNEQLTNNVDTIIKVSFKTRVVDREVIQLKDDDGREIRTMKVIKQREGRAGAEVDFVLRSVPDGTKNQYGDDRTSCVVEQFGQASPAGSSAPAQAKGPRLTPERKVILQALRTAVEDHGEAPPAVLHLPKSIYRVVHAGYWKRVYLEKNPDLDAPDNTINKRIRDASNQFQDLELIGRTNPYVWIVPGKKSKEALESLDTGPIQPEFPET